jgi:hypothetical protein
MKRLAAAIPVVVVIGAIAGGFYLLGPPAEERARRFDQRRESDLQRLQLATDLYWTRGGRLPASLEELARESGTGVYSQDPDSGQAYEYRVTGNGRYELCAAFARPSDTPGQFWSHGEGRRCFQVTAREIRP